jgi:hypothetical protein
MTEERVVDELQKELLQDILERDETHDAHRSQYLQSRFVLLPYSAQLNIFMSLMKAGASKSVPALCGAPPYAFLDSTNDYMNLSAPGFLVGRVNMARKSDIPSRRHFGKQYHDNQGRHFRLRTGIKMTDDDTLFVLLPNKKCSFPNVDDQLTLSPTNNFTKLTNLTNLHRIRVKGIHTTPGLSVTAALIYTLL